MIDYSVFFEYIKLRGLSEVNLEKDYGIPRAKIQRMRSGKNITVESVDMICNSLGCTIENIMRHIPSDNSFPVSDMEYAPLKKTKK